jgi:hypothetical protein
MGMRLARSVRCRNNSSECFVDRTVYSLGSKLLRDIAGARRGPMSVLKQSSVGAPLDDGCNGQVDSR